MRYNDLSEEKQLRIFVDFVRLCIGLDPLYHRGLTWRMATQPRHYMEEREIYGRGGAMSHSNRELD